MINGSLPSCCTARAKRLTDCCVLLFPSRRLQSSFRRYRYRVGWVCMMYSLELVDRFGLVDGRVWLCSVAVQQSVKTKLIKVRIASFVWDGTSGGAYHQRWVFQFIKLDASLSVFFLLRFWAFKRKKSSFWNNFEVYILKLWRSHFENLTQHGNPAFRWRHNNLV